jgi:hypothetical protein
MGKVVVLLGAVGALGAVAVVAAVLLLGGGGSGDPPVTPPPGEKDPPVNANLVKGASEMDFAANAAGKGGVILRVPMPVQEVAVTSSTGFRTEWDGTQNLRLKDLDPGAFRGKVKPKGGAPSMLADFSVEKDLTCLFTFNAAGGGSWEKSECR